MTVAVIACGALALDVRAIARRRGWEIEVHPVPALLHNRPERIPPAVRDEFEQLSDRYDRVVVAYGDCGTYGALDEVCAELGVERLDGEHCYDLFAREPVRREMEAEPGTYFLTDFLARTFDHTVVRELGLDRYPGLCQEYFRNYARVVWLAQRPTEANRTAAARAAARIGLPLEVRVVGNSGLERALGDVLTGFPSERTASEAVIAPDHATLAEA